MSQTLDAMVVGGILILVCTYLDKQLTIEVENYAFMHHAAAEMANIDERVKAAVDGA